jgi:arabinan endo-1,5-alpha-L-arabinosidase
VKAGLYGVGTTLKCNMTNSNFKSLRRFRPRIVSSVGLAAVLASGSLRASSPEPPAAALTNSVTAAGIAVCIRNAVVHDPSTTVKCKDEFWLFFTGRGVPSWHSTDLVTWTRGPSVFSTPPPWVSEAVPANRNLDFWAPDVIYLDGRYLLYYSASTFGKNVSGIGLAASPTLDPGDPSYGWTNAGPVILSTVQDDFNAIDPSVFHDADGSLWLAFGSFWSGIRMVQLDPKTGQRLPSSSTIWSLAHFDSIEASYLYQRGSYYFLFVNWGACCRGINSTYRICVGRSTKVTGPYLDKQGKDMLNGGGTLFLDTTPPYVGPGHAGIIEDRGRYWFSCHYEGIISTNGTAAGQRGSRLAVLPLRWTADDWPQLDLEPAN